MQEAIPIMNQIDNRFSLILASASPRRKNLLERLGLKLLVNPAHINEEA
jgi:predicted house-cleaning NTP pyrophosphatase (Maf/HAM1 superfamily)